MLAGLDAVLEMGVAMVRLGVPPLPARRIGGGWWCCCFVVAGWLVVVGGGGCAVGAYRHWYIGWSIPGAFQRGTDRVICSRVAWLDWCITHPYP